MAIAVATASFGLTSTPNTALAQDGATLEEIIVTARKREESLQEVPVAISVFTDDALKAAGINSARELFENTPGLNYDTGFDQNAATPAIRGVVSSEIATYRQKVTSFLDGMPIIGQQGSVPFAAIQQVEVLRGPQSAAFGRSTFGGAINYISAAPSEEWSANVIAEVGSNNLTNFSAMISGPLSDTVSALLAFENKKRDGEDDWVTIAERETLGGEDNTNALFKLVYEPTDWASFEFRYKYLDVDNEQTARAFAPLNDPNRQFHPDAVSPFPACGIGVPSPSCAYVGTVDAFDQTYDYNYAATGIAEPFVRDERDRYELAATFDLDNGMTIEALGFTAEEFYERATDSNLTNDANGFERDPTDINEEYFEVRLTSASDQALRWGIGASAYNYDFLTQIFRNLGAYQSGNGIRINENAENRGIFGNVVYDLNDTFTLSLEARYQTDDVAGGAPQADGSFLSLNQETKTFLPRLSLTYSPTENLTMYFQYAKGNNPAGINVGAVNAETVAASAAFPNLIDNDAIAFFKEEEVDSYEIGIKGNVNNRFNYAVNAYVLDWQNYTNPFGVNFEPADFVDVDDDNLGDAGTIYEGLRFSIPGRNFLGAGDVDGKGVEFEGRYAISDNLRVNLVASYIDITYADNACSTELTNYGVPANTSNSVGLPCVSIGGQELGTQPDLSGVISLDYNTDLGNGIRFDARWSTRFTSSQYVSVVNLAELEGYSISGVRAGLSRDNWRVTAYIDNLFGEDAPQGPQFFFDGRIPGPPPFATNLAYTARRDTAFGVVLSYDFGG